MGDSVCTITVRKMSTGASTLVKNDFELFSYREAGRDELIPLLPLFQALIDNQTIGEEFAKSTAK